MFKLDTLVPVILIICLLALAYLLSQIFSPAEQEIRSRPTSEIVLDADRYRDTEDLGAATNIDNNRTSDASSTTSANNSNNTTTATLDDYYEDGSRGTVEGDNKATATSTDSDDDKYYEEEDYSSTDTHTGTDTQTATETANTTTTRQDIRRGEYHVIAGSFRQKIYAQQLVRELKRDGFSDAYVGYMNRGAYAVAVAGSSSSYSTAKQLGSRVKGEGYDVFVKKGE